MIVINLNTKNEYEIEVSKNGENHMTCPVCSADRKKSKLKCFSFNYEKKAGRCNHCNVVLVEKRDYVPEVHYKRPVWEPQKTNLSDRLVAWFKSRKISVSTILDFKITEGPEWMPQTQKEVNTVHFNYFRNGELINIKFRDALKNFKLVSEAELIPYNIDAVICAKQVIWVEGEIDCHSVHESGYRNVISVPNGATIGRNNLTYLDNVIDMFEEDTEHILAFDGDNAGLSLMQEFVRRLGASNCSKVSWRDTKDANECLVKYGPEAVRESIDSRVDFPVSGIFTASDIDSEIDDYHKNGLPQGCDIGLPEFDNLLKFHEGYITTFTGIPGHGKSEVVDFLTIRLNILHQWKWAIYSPENYPLQLHFSKYAEKIIGKSFNFMNQSELAAAKKLFNENFFFIKPEEDSKLESILDKALFLVKKKGIRGLVIDAWNKIEHLWEGSETQYISRKLDELALFCERKCVHLFLVAHPTKIQKDKNTGLYEVPNLYNINGSANFFNKTHNGISVYRNFTTGRSEIYVQKVKFKHWGQPGCVEMEWDWKTGRYYQHSPDHSNWITGSNKQLTIDVNKTIEAKKVYDIPLGDIEIPF